MTDLQARFDAYAACHRHPLNLAVHAVAVPVAVWSVIALLWLVPVPPDLGKPGLWAVAAMFVAYLAMLRHSRPIAWMFVAGFIVLGALAALAWHGLGPQEMGRLAVTLLVASLLAQVVGHRLEEQAPRLADVPGFLVIGPAWFAARLLRRFKVDY